MNLCVIGGHSGDEAVAAGALIHKYTRHGHRAVLLSLTNGDGGHPELSREEYRIQKDREAVEAAAVLGAEAVLFPISSGQLPVSNEVAEKMAAVFEEHKIDCIITHWRDCIHTDHVAAHYNTLKACQKWGKSVPVFFAENWEDSQNYCPEYRIALDPDDIDAWAKACNCFEFFRKCFYKFQYEKYYRNLFANHGFELRGKYGCALMPYRVPGPRGSDCIPGFDIL